MHTRRDLWFGVVVVVAACWTVVGLVGLPVAALSRMSWRRWKV